MFDTNKKYLLDNNGMGSRRNSHQSRSYKHQHDKNRWHIFCKSAFGAMFGLLAMLMLTGCWAMGEKSRTDVILGPISSDKTEINIEEIKEQINSKENGPTHDFETMDEEQE